MKRKRAPTSESAFPCARHERKSSGMDRSFSFCNKEASLAAGAAALPYGADTGPRCSDCAGGAGGISTLPRDPYFPFPPEKPQHFAFLACDAMVTSFHSPEKKGRKEKGPPARRKIPVARTPGRVRSPVGASCAATGIFLMAGVTKPLIRRAANTVRRRKNEKGGSHCPPGPGAGPAHFGSYLSHSFR